LADNDIARSIIGYMIAGVDPLLLTKPKKPVEDPMINYNLEFELTDSVEQLELVKQEALVCQKCHLAKTRTQVVFGQGDPKAKLVFVGEAPGQEEDIQGLAFVGRAGQLLTRMITAMKLSREQVYICNILKCRPPENRTPAPEEVLACQSYLERQLVLIKPNIICALGLVSAQWLLGTKEALGRLRGKFLPVPANRGLGLADTRIMVTYHPAAVLRFPNYKKDVWEDLQKIMKELGVS
jgi:uracil-DNA glycosylase family 4